MKKFLGNVLWYVIDIVKCIFPVVFMCSAYLVPPIIFTFGFEKIAFTTFLIETIIIGIFFMLILAQYIFYRKNGNVNQMNRCIHGFNTIGVSMFFGIFGAIYVGII